MWNPSIWIQNVSEVSSHLILITCVPMTCDTKTIINVKFLPLQRHLVTEFLFLKPSWLLSLETNFIEKSLDLVSQYHENSTKIALLPYSPSSIYSDYLYYLLRTWHGWRWDIPTKYSLFAKNWRFTAKNAKKPKFCVVISIGVDHRAGSARQK